jgi:hypothetical protein
MPVKIRPIRISGLIEDQTLKNKNAKFRKDNNNR